MQEVLNLINASFEPFLAKNVELKFFKLSDHPQGPTFPRSIFKPASRKREKYKKTIFGTVDYSEFVVQLSLTVKAAVSDRVVVFWTLALKDPGLNLSRHQGSSLFAFNF